MREIEGSIFSHLNFDKDHPKGKIDVSSTEPLFVNTFIELVKKIAYLSFENKDYLLFYRGQTKDYLNRAGNSSFYPSIYRTAEGENLSKEVLAYRFKILSQASFFLVEKFKDYKINDSLKELKKRKYIQWSILQHYEVCGTPLLDLTQSLRVACSFALSTENQTGNIFVFGLPYITNRISINSEQDIINVRLINICPPQALRPYFQEGYLVGTDDILDNYEEKSELDFKRRLIAKFKIPNSPEFWGDQKSLVNYLKPQNDEIEIICNEIKNQLKAENNIEIMFPGTWINEFILPNGKLGSEKVNIINGNMYLANDKHYFNLDCVTIDQDNKTIKFRKHAINNDMRRNFETLKIISSDHYEGIGSHGSKVKYTRIG